MKAILVNEGQLNWTDTAEPVCGNFDVLIQVAAAGVNRADLLQADGKYPPPKGVTPILGLEAAGTVIEVGKFISRSLIGKRVCALLSGGGYAERVAVPFDMCFEIPAQLSIEEAAAIPEVWFTAYLNLVKEGDLRAGDRVLIHAGASGVGTAAIQLCRFFGAVPFVTVGSDEKQSRCKALGAELAVNYKTQNFREELQCRSAQIQFDLILDPVGGSYLGEHLQLLKTDGVLVIIGLMGGAKAELDMLKVLQKRLKLKGSTLRNRSRLQNIQLAEQFRIAIWPALKRGELKPVLDSCFPIEEAAAAHAHLRANKNIGKVVLRLPQTSL